MFGWTEGTRWPRNPFSVKSLEWVFLGQFGSGVWSDTGVGLDGALEMKFGEYDILSQLMTFASLPDLAFLGVLDLQEWANPANAGVSIDQSRQMAVSDDSRPPNFR